MSKESEAIIKAYQLGSNDKRLKKPYRNPFNKNKNRSKHRAYRNGYNE
jgi:hypothetical protein